MGLRDRLGGAGERLATLLSRLFVTAPDHPSQGGLTGEDRETEAERERDQ